LAPTGRGVDRAAAEEAYDQQTVPSRTNANDVVPRSGIWLAE